MMLATCYFILKCMYAKPLLSPSKKYVIHEGRYSDDVVSALKFPGYSYIDHDKAAHINWYLHMPSEFSFKSIHNLNP